MAVALGGWFGGLIFYLIMIYLVYNFFKYLDSKKKETDTKEQKLPIYSLITNKRELPGVLTTFFCALFIFGMFILTVNLHWAWTDAQYDYAEEYCNDNYEWGDSNCDYWHGTSETSGNFYMPYFDTEGPTMFDDYSSDHPFMADGPWIWIGYFSIAFLLSICIIGRGFREIRSLELNYKKRKAETALIPMLAIDPKCVSDGRITLPPPIEPLYPTLVEKFSSPMLILTTVLVTLGMFSSVIYELLNGGLQDNFRINLFSSSDNFDEYVLTTFLAWFACMVVYICYTLFPYFDRPIFEDSVSLLSPQMTGIDSNVNLKSVIEEPIIESNEPARIDAVIQILELEMLRARQETQRLKGELNVANEKVVTLNSELDEKSTELEDMRVVKKNMQHVLEEQSQGDGKSLTMADSVLVGDALFGSTKIDQQIINDPAAIAKAAIEAYQQGKKDAEK